MKNLLSTIILLLTLGFTYSQVTETFDGVTISGASFTTNSGLSFTTSDTFESWLSNESESQTELSYGGVILTAPIPHVYLDQSGSYFEFTPTSADKLLSSLSFDLWYSNSNSGTTLACECKSYDSSGNLLETITKDVIAKAYTFSGTPKKIRCNITEINSDNAVFFDDLTFTLVDESSTSESVPFSFNSTNPLGIESTFSNNSTGNYSFSVGIANTASGEHSSAFGQETTASGLSSFAGGKNTTASGNYAVAMGIDNTASGDISLAMGGGTTASGFNSTSFGSNTTASGGNSVAMGHFTKASDYGSLVIGYYNDSGSSITAFDDRFDDSNTAFVIGNGVNNDNRSDALVVNFDGTTTIAGDLNVNSDARLKSNIVSLGATLTKLLQIDGKTYSMKKDKNEKPKIGLLAQDIERVFPELVSENNGIKSVNYQGLIPVLINALKDQQSEIDELKSMVVELINKN